MNTNSIISWESLEYKEDIKTTDWFWALAIIVISGSVIAIIFKNYFLAGILVLGGIMLSKTVNLKPEMLNYELNDKGLKIKNSLYLYETISEFSILEDRPVLIVRSERMLFPLISMAFPIGEEENIKKIFTEHKVKEGKFTEHTADKIVRFLGI